MLDALINVWIYAFKSIEYANADIVASVFLWFIFLFFISALINIICRIGFVKKLTSKIADKPAIKALKLDRFGRFFDGVPGLLTTLGVLGTFVGIAIGLAGFNVNDVAGSVPRLLEGLKLAFATSIAGMGTAATLKAARLIVISIITETDDTPSINQSEQFISVDGERVKLDVSTAIMLKSFNIICGYLDSINKELEESRRHFDDKNFDLGIETLNSIHKDIIAIREKLSSRKRNA